MMIRTLVLKPSLLMTQFKLIENSCLFPIDTLNLASITAKNPTFGGNYFASQIRCINLLMRSPAKIVKDLERVAVQWKVAYKVLFLMEVLKKEPEHVIQVRSLEKYKSQVVIRGPDKVSDLIGKLPKLFELYEDFKGVLWCGMTQEAEDLVQEETRILDEYSGKVAEYVTRFLMMSVDKRLPLSKIAHLRRDLGLPHDFGKSWVHKYPQQFRVVKDDNDIDYLELVSWNPDWAVTELEKKTFGVIGAPPPSTPGMLYLHFPIKRHPYHKKLFLFRKKREKIVSFQNCPYLSPYADACGLKAGSLEFNKRAVAVMHELLSFTMEKRMFADHLTYFRRELLMPQKPMRLLLKYDGVFYVSLKGKRFGAFLNEAYDRFKLIEKCPWVLWREKVERLIYERRSRMKIETIGDLSEVDDNDLVDSDDAENANICSEHEQETMRDLEDTSLQ